MLDTEVIETIRYNDAGSWNYDPTAEEYYYGFGCTIVSTGAKIPIVAEFTPAKQASQETAIWMLGDSAYDILDWHDPCGQQEGVPVAPYNPRNLTTRKTSSTGSKTVSRNTARTYSSSNPS